MVGRGNESRSAGDNKGEDEKSSDHGCNKISFRWMNIVVDDGRLTAGFPIAGDPINTHAWRQRLSHRIISTAGT